MSVPAVSMLNVSSVILRKYPETSPWDLTPTVFGTVSPDLSNYTALSKVVRNAALSQVQHTGVNPFYFACWSNPFMLDDSTAGTAAALPFDPSPTSVSLLPRFQHSDTMHPIIFVKEIHAKDAQIVCQVRIENITRVLKLYLGNQATLRFSTELVAYTRFHHLRTSNSGAVPHCYGWVEVDRQILHTMLTSPGVSSFLRDAITNNGALPHAAKGILLEDLTDAEVLTIHNVTPKIANQVLHSLYAIHTSHVLHGMPSDHHNILWVPAEQRAVWVGFSCSSAVGTVGSTVTRQSLLAELAAGWDLLHQRLLPDSLIGFKAADNSFVDTRRATASAQASTLTVRQRPSSENVRDEIVSILFSYPEVNLFTWSPPIFNLVSTSRTDHQYDTQELLQALRDDPNAAQTLFTRYGSCPLGVFDLNFQHTEGPSVLFPGYVAPAPLPQLPSETDIEFLEHIRPRSNHALMRVRIGSNERVLKIFSKDRLSSVEDYITSKQRFVMERDAYAHLLGYGACASGSVTQCYGWIELTPAHVYGAISMIPQTREREVLKEDEEGPVWVSPIFEDGSFAAALVLEYLPNAEPLVMSNVTHSRADLALRALSCVHGAYVLHRDLRNTDNVLITRGADGAERVVIVDFDFAKTPRIEPYLRRIEILEELYHMWLDLFEYLLPLRRITCQGSHHPHCELDVY